MIFVENSVNPDDDIQLLKNARIRFELDGVKITVFVKDGKLNIYKIRTKYKKDTDSNTIEIKPVNSNIITVE